MLIDGEAFESFSLIAKAFNMSINKDVTHTKKILNKLFANGGYCPCMPSKTTDTICPCKNMRRHKACRCGLFVRKGDDNV